MIVEWAAILNFTYHLHSILHLLLGDENDEKPKLKFKNKKTKHQ